MLIFLWVHLSVSLPVYSDGTTRIEFGSETKVLTSLLKQALGENVKGTPCVSHGSQPISWPRRKKRNLGLRLVK